MNITESIKFNKIKEENETLKKELAEKDRKIDKYINNEAILNSNIMGFIDYIKKLKQQQLYKEDFETKFIEYSPTLVKEKYVLKDNSIYEKLPSKDVK